MSFSTLEDVNGTSFDNQGFWWYEVDTALIDPDGTAEFTDVKFDFCTISKRTSISFEGQWEYTVKVDNSLWTKGVTFLTYDGRTISGLMYIISGGFTYIIRKEYAPIRILIYLGNSTFGNITKLFYYLIDNVLNLNLKQLLTPQTITVGRWGYDTRGSVVQSLNQGYNEIFHGTYSCGYLLVKLLKTDFQFQCTQSLIVGKVNTVRLGTLTDYKPNGDLVGEYATKLSVLYNDKTLPVVWNESLNDYTFDLDLTDKTDEGKIHFKVNVEASDVLNSSETDVVLESKYETINTLTKLTNLFKIGGTGRLSSDLTLNSDLTLTKDVLIIGNDKTLNLNQHKIVVPSERTFKAENTSFTNGVNSIQQYTGSSVDLTDCTFNSCTGFGSVIDCQVDLASLDESDDFNTKLNNCTISNCDMAILHGGNLEVNGCSVIGKISNKNYPYFLYQTDGNATILNTEFNLSKTRTTYNYDLEFNTCIFTCGETAQINGYSHSELQANNLQNFLSVQRNTSKIDITYYYPSIDDYIHLQSDNGYCHSVSGVDFVFKTNINLSRGD